MKLSLALPATAYFIFCLYKYHAVPFPAGVCSAIDCGGILQFPKREIVVLLLTVATLLYIFEKYMLLSTSLLFVTALLVLSVDECNGNPAENGITTLLFFVQLLAYVLYAFNPQSALHKKRMQFSLQIVAAVYVLSGLSKLMVGGVAWFTTDVLKIYPRSDACVLHKIYRHRSRNIHENGSGSSRICKHTPVADKDNTFCHCGVRNRCFCNAAA